ncbi:MAG: glycosyltransferase [Verrucomicrobiae bacterium]|nr:glycosyltransferase [Verrucomicrobiae bacterium]
MALTVAFLTHEPFYPPTGGGSSEAIYLVQELVRRGHRVRLFCPQVEEPEKVAREFRVHLEPFTRWRMGRYARLRNLKYLAFPWFLEQQVARSVQREPVQVILSQHTIASVAAGRLKKRLGICTVMNYLDFLTGFMEAWPPYVAPPFLLRRLEHFEVTLPRRYGADGVLAISDTMAEHLAQAGCPRERICPIYFGYDPAVFPLRPPDLVPPPEKPVVVMHGSFDQHHLGPIALEGMAELVRRRPEVVLRFVGRETPSLLGFVERLRNQVPHARVELTGFTPYHEVARHLHTASVGLVPYEETTGTHCAFVAKIVEYLGVGLPVVSTALRSISRYFADEPLARFVPFAGRPFAEAVLHQLQLPHDQQIEWGQRASARVQRELAWQVISRKAVNFVERVAGDGSNPRQP